MKTNKGALPNKEGVLTQEQLEKPEKFFNSFSAHLGDTSIEKKAAFTLGYTYRTAEEMKEKGLFPDMSTSELAHYLLASLEK